MCQPGAQTDTAGWDDNRNARMPLPAQRGAGIGGGRCAFGTDLSGPPGWTMTRAGNMPALPELMLASLPGSDPLASDSLRYGIGGGLQSKFHWGLVEGNGQMIEHEVRLDTTGASERASGREGKPVVSGTGSAGKPPAGTTDHQRDPRLRKLFALASDSPESMFDGGPRNSAGEVAGTLYSNVGSAMARGTPLAPLLGWLGYHFGYSLGETADMAAGGAMSRYLDSHSSVKVGLQIGLDALGFLASGGLSSTRSVGLKTGLNLIDDEADDIARNLGRRGIGRKRTVPTLARTGAEEGTVHEHHVIPRRFGTGGKRGGQFTNEEVERLRVRVGSEWHNKWHTGLRQTIGHNGDARLDPRTGMQVPVTATATREEVLRALKEHYRDYPVVIKMLQDEGFIT